MTRTLFRNGRVHGQPAATCLAVEDGRIAFVGDEDGAATYDGADEVRRPATARSLAPAFVDAHVHTVRTGFALTGLDLSGTPSLATTLDDLAAFADDAPRPRRPGRPGLGRDRLARAPAAHRRRARAAAPARRTYLTRVDGHSSVVSPALAALVPGLDALDGWTPDGRVERDAHHAVRAVLEGLIGPDERLDAARAACRAMAAQGIAAFHENAAPHIGPEHEIEMVAPGRRRGRAARDRLLGRADGRRDRPAARRRRARRRPGRRRRVRLPHGRPLRAVRRPARHLRPRLRDRRAGARPRRRLHPRRPPGRLPLHRRRRAREHPRGLRGRRARARRRRRSGTAGTGSSTSRCRHAR